MARLRQLTLGQIKAHAATRAKGLLHWNMARDCSDEGLTKLEAQRRLGMTEAGLNTLLRRNTGTQRWPIGANNAD